jgi:hypothetical protein
VSKQEINITDGANGNTLQVKFKYNEYFTKSLNRDYSEFTIKQDSLGHEVMYSNRIQFYVLKTDEAKPYVQVEKIAEGSSIPEARKSAETIKYNFKVQGNTLILDNYLLTGANSKYHGQRVEIFLYLPEGTLFQPDASLQDYDDTDNEFFDLWFDGDNHIYQMGETKVECLDCVTDDADITLPPVPELDDTAPMSDEELKAYDRAMKAYDKEVQAYDRKHALRDSLNQQIIDRKARSEALQRMANEK